MIESAPLLVPFSSASVGTSIQVAQNRENLTKMCTAPKHLD